MIIFINMDFDGTQWWIEYVEDGVIKKEYFASESLANDFYLSII